MNTAKSNILHRHQYSDSSPYLKQSPPRRWWWHGVVQQPGFLHTCCLQLRLPLTHRISVNVIIGFYGQDFFLSRLKVRVLQGVQLGTFRAREMFLESLRDLCPNTILSLTSRSRSSRRQHGLVFSSGSDIVSSETFLRQMCVFKNHVHSNEFIQIVLKMIWRNRRSPKGPRV